MNVKESQKNIGSFKNSICWEPMQFDPHNLASKNHISKPLLIF